MAQIHAQVPDEIFRRAKLLAVTRAMFFKAWIAEAIEAYVVREEKKAAK